MDKKTIAPILGAATLVLCFLLIGCNQRAKATSTFPIADTMSLPLQTATYTLENTPSPAPSMTVTPSPRPTDTPSPTSIPTLSPEEARELILKLNQGNAGCQLPCWWGITPGETKGAEVLTFFSIFNLDIYYTRDSAWVRFTFPPRARKEYYQGIAGFYVSIGNPYGTVTLIDVSNASGMYESVSKFLIVNGKPDEVWIETYSEYSDNNIPYTVVLFYKRLGTLAIWGQWIKDPMGDVLTGCMSEGPHLKLWGPKVQLTMQEVQDIFSSGGISGGEPYLPLAKATNMNVEQFYQTYKDPGVIPCIRTPKNLWPNPFAH